jgi:hypothetical protein
MIMRFLLKKQKKRPILGVFLKYGLVLQFIAVASKIFGNT